MGSNGHKSKNVKADGVFGRYGLPKLAWDSFRRQRRALVHRLPAPCPPPKKVDLEGERG